MTTGWLCPKCGSGVAPSVERCPCGAEAKKAIGNPLDPFWNPQSDRSQYVRGYYPRLPVTNTMFCPCRKENGGSGVCGCILSGQTFYVGDVPRGLG